MAEVFRRLELSPAAQSYDQARANFEKILDEVEDEFSGVPKNPDRWQSDGRLYMPQADSERKSTQKGVRKFRTKGHFILFGANGSIEVQDLTGKRVHYRAGGK